MKLSRLVVLGLVLLPVGLIAYQLRQNLQSQLDAEVDSKDALVDMLPEVFQMIQNFRRVEIRDGNKIWELEAEEAQYMRESNVVVVREPRVSFFLDDGSEVRISGEQGEVLVLERELKGIKVQDNVEIHVRDFVILVESAAYDRKQGQIVTPGPVHILGKTLELWGRGMKVDIESSNFTIDESVRVTFRPDSEDASAS